MIIKSVLNAGTEQLDTKAVSTSGICILMENCFEIIDGTRYIVGFDGRFKKLRLGGGGVTNDPNLSPLRQKNVSSTKYF